MRNRVNSNDSEVNDLENRPDTPLRRINSAKKTEMEESGKLPEKSFLNFLLILIKSLVLTPTKRATRGNSVIRTILEEQIIASPLRRVTRRMSSDIMSSPQPSTKPVHQTLNDSDGECVFVSEQPATPRTITTARNKSKEKVKLEEVVEEEPDINDKLNTSLDSNDSNNDLELRNRVIAKSPVVVLNRIHVSPSSNLLSTETKEVGEKIVKALSQSPQKTPSKKFKDAKIDVTKIAEEVEEHDTKIDDDQSEKDKSVTENGDGHDGEQEEQKSETSNVEEQQNASGSVDENDASKNTSANASESLGPLNKGMIDKTPSRLTNGEGSAREIVIQKVEYKQPNSSFWNTSITGNSDRIDKAPGNAVGETQIINLSKSIEMQTYRRSSAAQSDSDESEAEVDEKRSMTSLIIDEAEVANSDEDSMTPSEKEDLRENDHIDDGESLGSQDSTGQHGHGSEADTVENDSFIDDEELEDQYSLDSHEELVEKLKESPTKRRSRVIASSSSSDGENEPVISPSKRKSKVIESSSEEEVVPEADKSTSPMKENVTPEKNAEEISPVEKSPSKSPVKRKSLFTFKRPSLASQMQFDTTGSPFSSTQKFGGWLFEGGKDKPELLSTATLMDQAIERKRKRESVVHDAVPKRFKEMSPNESEAVHMDIFEGLITKDNDNDNDNENEVAEVPVENPEVPVDIPKLISHCDEYLEKHNQELKAKVALKRQKKKEKLLKNEEAAKVNAENAETVSPIPKKKKNKSKAKKQKLLADETEKNDMATKLNKQMELLQLKRERKKLKKEMKAAEAAKEKVEEAAPVKIKKKVKKSIIFCNLKFN